MGDKTKSRPRAKRPTTARPPKTLTRGAQLLRAWRVDSGLTQYQVIQLLGLGYDLLSPFELGRRKPNLELAVRIQRETGVPVEAWTQPATARRRATA